MVSSVFQEVAVATAHMASKYDSHSEPSLSAKVHRIQSGVSLDSICERTKISRYFLEAIEERAYHRLPGGVFDINYIRQYSESVGCNADLLLADYQSASQDAHSVERVTQPHRSSKTWWRSLLLLFCTGTGEG
jgi:cytoskeletal protein RodZ